MFIRLSFYDEDGNTFNKSLDLFSIESLEIFDMTNLESGTWVELKSGKQYHCINQIHKLEKEITTKKSKFAKEAIVEYLMSIK